MTKKSDFSSAYIAGREAFDGRRVGIYISTALAMLIGPSFEEWLTSHYALPWFERFPLYVLVMVLIVGLTALVEDPVKRALDSFKRKGPA